MSQPSDDEHHRWCLSEIAKRNEWAMGQLYDATAARLYAVALRIARDPRIAEEAVSDTYFQVWQQAPSYDAARGKVLSWMFTICRSRVLDHLRRRDPAELQGEIHVLQENASDTGSDPADLLSLYEESSRVHQVLQELNPTQRKLISMAFFLELSHQDIANKTGLPLGTVKATLRRTLLALRQVLGASARCDEGPA